jgi:hypothetical protein
MDSNPEQLVGDLWTSCGVPLFIPYHGLLAWTYSHKPGVTGSILTNQAVSVKKLAIANLIRPPGRLQKKCGLHAKHPAIQAKRPNPVQMPQATACWLG